MSVRVLSLAALAVAFLVSFSSQAAAQKPRPPRGEKSEAYQVVQSSEGFQIVKKSEVKALMQKRESDYKDAVKAWEEAKKAARKEKQKFTEPKPKKSPAKVHGQTFKSEADAQAYVAKMEAKLNKGKKRDDG